MARFKMTVRVGGKLKRVTVKAPTRQAAEKAVKAEGMKIVR